MKRIEINGEFADLLEESIGLNWQYFDVSNPGLRINPFTSTIKLPFTPKNKRLLGYGDVIGGNMTAIRNVANVNYWFGSYKVISNGYLRVTDIDDAFVCSITAKNQLVKSLETLTFTEIVDGALEVLSPTYATAIASLAAGTTGWLLPRTLVGDITSANFYIGGRREYQRHELWISAARVFERIIEATGCSFKIAESGAIIDFDDSDAYADMNKLYTPAWAYYMASALISGTVNYAVRKLASYDTKLYNGKRVEVNTLTLFGGKTPLDFVRIIAQMIGAIIDISGTIITFVPINELSGFTPLDFSGKVASYQKGVNIPSLEAENEIGYKNTDNLPPTYGKILVTAPVTPVTKKSLLEIPAMLPGLYVPSLYAGFVNAYQFFDTDYGKNGDLASTPLLLYDGGNTISTTVQWGTEGSPEQSSATLLKRLTHFPLTGAYEEYQEWVTAGGFFEADIALNLFDFMRLRSYKLARIPELGGTFFINKITNFDPYSNKPAKMQLVRTDTPPVITLYAPLNLEAVAISSTEITLTWDDNSTIEDGYSIERKLLWSSTWYVIGTAAANATTYADDTCSPATSYVYRVRATMGAEYSEYSDTAVAETEDAVIVTPTVSCEPESGATFTITDNGGSISIDSDQLTFSFSWLDGWYEFPALMNFLIKDAENNTVHDGSLSGVSDGEGPFGDTVTLTRTAVSGDVFTVVLEEYYTS